VRQRVSLKGSKGRLEEGLDNANQFQRKTKSMAFRLTEARDALHRKGPFRAEGKIRRRR